MRRREFIAGLAGAAAWPLAVGAQQSERMRRLGVLIPREENEPEAKDWLSAFTQELAELGWTDGRNVRIDVRWASGIDRARMYAKELVDLQPDVILSQSTPVTAAFQRETRTIPIVFVFVADPVGSGFVASLPRPSGNITGFIDEEAGMASKWLELLTQIAPGVKRVGVLRDIGQVAASVGHFSAIQSVAPSLGIEAIPVNVRDADGIENAISSFVHPGNSGLIVTGSGLAVVNRNLIITVAARHQLPAVYFARMFVSAGGLISYGTDFTDQFRRAAGYVDRILKGEKPADLPVQAATKFDTVINLKTARALGLDVPPTLLARADEVIE